MCDEKTLTRRAKAMEKRLRQVQRHHITYEPEWIVPIFMGEHWTITQLQRRVHVSRGFLESMEFEINRLKEGVVYDLDMPEPRDKKRRSMWRKKKKRKRKKKK